MNESAISAMIAGSVALVVAWLSHRRAQQTRRDEIQKAHDDAANDEIRAITEAYKGLLDDLRKEISRLIEARLQDRARWEIREAEMEGRIKELEHRLTVEVAERERLETRVNDLVSTQSQEDPNVQP